MNRHPQISIKNVVSTSLITAVGFNTPQGSRLFSKFQEVIQRYSFAPPLIFSAEETGVSFAQLNQQVLSVRGKKLMGKLIPM
jgi:hypothetical protein